MLRNMLRKRENEGEEIYCARCGKKTSTYNKKIPAVGVEMATQCMCTSPEYFIPDIEEFKKEVLRNNAEIENEV